jgi:enoyl-CoA hydratase/carnithine racemase
MNEDHGYSLELTEAGAGVALIRFSDPGRRNQICWAAVSELADLLDLCVQQDKRVVVLASALDGHWFEHAWLRDLEAGMAGGETTGDGAGWFRAVNTLSRSSLVSIAAISGDTCGGGCELGWACDLRVAEKQARFAQPEVRVGIPPGLGGASRLSTLVGRSLAGEMVLDGGWTPAERLYQAGAVNRLVDSGQAEATALAWAQKLAAQDPAALAACKQVLSDTEELTLQEALKNEQSILQRTATRESTREIMRAQQQFYDSGGTTSESFE